MNDFILKTDSNQIINLGAGFDASFFRLKHQNRLEKTLFIEVSKSKKLCKLPCQSSKTFKIALISTINAQANFFFNFNS